jgi:hypothetical protein
MRGDGKSKVLDAMRYTAKEKGDGLTAYTLARVTGLSPQHVNHLLSVMWHEGEVGYRQEVFKNTFRRKWATTSRCKKMNKNGGEWTITDYVINQLELPF